MGGKVAYPSLPVLMVDDNDNWLNSFEMKLSMQGINNIISVSDGREVLPLLKHRGISVLLLDLGLPGVSGWEILERVTVEYPEVPVVIITGNDETANAVSCVKTGAYDYFVKGAFDDEKMALAVQRAVELREIKNENRNLKGFFLSDRTDLPEAFSGIITADKKMRAVLQYAAAVAPSSNPVLITGETGVGKELIARALHDLSRRRGRFVAVNVAGLDDNVFTDTLFGHLKGAFTDAAVSREGLVVKAVGGTLLLDEIGDISPQAQLKLLRILQEREFFPLGADIPRKTDARVVATTQSTPAEILASGRFRKDLFYRLSTHHVHIPPLRERPEDVPLLFNHFLQEAARSMDKQPPLVSESFYSLLSAMEFPGNVRELRSMVHDAVVNHRSGPLSISTFKKRGVKINHRVVKQRATGDGVCGIQNPPEETETVFSLVDPLPTIKESARQLVMEALKRSRGNRGAASRMLGITPQALSWRLKGKQGK